MRSGAVPPVGFFAVVGIAARDGFMPISHRRHLERHEGEAFGPVPAVRGARERLWPLPTTALASAT